MKKIFIYSSSNGQSLKICKALNKNKESLIIDIDMLKTANLDNFDQIVIGASVKYGDHNKKVYEFVKKNRVLLEKKKTVFFSVNATARKSEKNTPKTNPYIIKFLKKTNWTPDHIGVFAGMIDFPNYNFIEKYIIKLIMWITNGPTDTSKTFEFTNWEDVKKFSEEIN
tara:strand:- start:1024 stop:1527 length:504 start_codon:yes stop_codon:yes gene_type:complete